jgi:hypothetical protein
LLLVLCLLPVLSPAEDPPTVVKAVHEATAELKKKAEAADKEPAKKVAYLRDAKAVELNDVIQFEDGSNVYVHSVVDKSTAVVRCYGGRTSVSGGSGGNLAGRFGAGSVPALSPLDESVLFLVKSMPTEGWVDDKPVNLTGRFKATATEKVGGRTVFVLSPVPDKKADAVAAANRYTATIKARDAEVIAAWSKAKMAASAKAESDFPIPKDGTFGEQAARKIKQEKAGSEILAGEARRLAALYDLSVQEAEKLLKH